MQKIGIFYGSSTGNVEAIAEQLQKLFGESEAQIFDVFNKNVEEVQKFDNIILGCSTWGFGNLQDDFEDFLPQLNNIDFEGKKVAIFGCGDQDEYYDTFADAVGEIYAFLKEKNCNIVGETSTEGYDFEESQAVVDGNFVGLVLDVDNQNELTEERIQNWVSKLRTQFN